MNTQFYASLSFFLIGIFVGSAISIYFINKLFGIFDTESEYEKTQEEKEYEYIDTPIGRIPVSGIVKLEIPKPSTEDGAKDLLVKMASLKKYQHDLDVNIKESVSDEDYIKTAKLQKSLDQSEKWHESRRHFFESRIGKKVIANKITCECELCKESLLVGVDVENEQHAVHLLMVEIDAKLDGNDVEFRDM